MIRCVAKLSKGIPVCGQFQFAGSMIQLGHDNQFGGSISPVAECRASDAVGTAFDTLIKALKGFTG